MGQPEQHQAKNFAAVDGNNDSHDAKRAKDAYSSKIDKNHPTLRPKNSWKPRGSGSDHGAGPKL